MAPDHASRDTNSVTTLLAVSNADGISPVLLWADPVSHRLLVQLASLTSLFQTNVYTATNSQTVFTATNAVVVSLYLSVNGIIQTLGIDYTITGNVATLTAGIPAGSAVVWVYVSSSSVGLQTDVFTATSNQNLFTASNTSAYTLYLSVNGVIQTPNVDYTVSGGVATLTNGVPSGTIVTWLYSTS